MLSKSFKPGKCKTSLKLAVARIKLLKNKRDVQVKQMRRDLAQLLEAGQDQTARIRVEHVIREEKTMSAYDLIELYCELIVARLAIIESQKKCPVDLKEAIASVIFASPRCADIPELSDVRKHFVAKYGKEFATSALELRPDSGVNHLIVEKLSAKAPDIEIKIKVLTAIAQEHSIKWDPKAFEEQVPKPPGDLLNGPTSFTNKVPVESTIHFPPSTGEKHKSVTKPNEKHVERSSSGSNSFTPPKSVQTASHSGPRATGSTYNGDESARSYSQEEVASFNRQKWTMEFKDATSAAQAAAESAERASMAARAAAELASRGHDPEYSPRSYEPSTYGSKHEAGNLMDSNLQGESRTRDSAKRGYSIDEAAHVMNQRMQGGREADVVQRRVTRDSKRVNEEPESRNASSSTVGSSSGEDVIEVNQQCKKIENDDSSGEESAERHPITPVSSYSSNRPHDGNAFSDIQKSDNQTPESFFKADPVNQNLSKRTDIADAGQGGFERKPSRSLSSHSSASSIHHKTIWDSPMHKNYVNQNSLFDVGQENDQGDHKLGFSDDASAVFDRSDSENDDHSEIDHFMQKHDLDPTLQQSQASFHRSSSNMEYAHDQPNRELDMKDGSHSLLHSVSRVKPKEFSGSVRVGNTPSQSDTVVYDVSDGASSDSDDEMDEFTERGGTDLNSLHNKQNVHKYEHHKSPSRSSLKDMETMDRHEQSSSSFTAADTKSHLGCVGGNELNFERLTGGLRNKGYVQPPYKKSPVVDGSLSSETSVDDSSRKPMASPRDKATKFEDVNKNVDNWNLHFKTNEDLRSRYENSFDSDSTDVDVLEERPLSESGGYRGVTSHSSTSRLDDKYIIDNKEKISNTFVIPESKELSQERSYKKSIGGTSRESRRMSARAYSDKDTEKQPLSPAQLQDYRGATASIPSNQKPDDNKSAVSSTHRASGHTGIHDKISSVKTKGSGSTAVPFFDEENDKDEVLQPQHTDRNLVIRGGRRLSQRTRGSKVNQISDFSSSSPDMKSPGLGNKSSEPTSSVSETPSKPSTSSVKPEKNRISKFLPPNLSVEQHSAQFSASEVLAKEDGLLTRNVSETPFESSTSDAKPEKNRTSKFVPPNLSIEKHPAQCSENEVLVQKDRLEPSQDSLPRKNSSQSVSAQTGVLATNENVKPSPLAGGSTSRENSLKGSHVHPKLPDYETLSDYFKTLRSNRR